MGRLTATELRKMVDTRSGIALLCVIELLAAAVAVIQMIAARPQVRGLETFFQGALVPVSILLPVVAILSVTSEWSQRTSLTTFALVPRRERVLAAKVVGAVALALVAVAAALGTAAAVNAVGGAFGHGGTWHLDRAVVPEVALAEVLFVLLGVGFGALLLSSPVAIVLYFVIPTAWTILGATVRWLHDWAAWLDLNTTTTPLHDGANLTARGWEQLAASAGLWVLLPLLVGGVRVLRGEVK